MTSAVTYAHRPRWWRPPAMAYIFMVCLALDILLVPGAHKLSNLANVGQDASILLFAALGQALVLITAGLDLSAGAAVGLLSVVVLQTAAGGHEYGAIFAGLAVALLIGAINGGIIGGIRVPPLLVTLGTMTACTGIASMLSGGAPIFSHTDLVGSELVYGRLFGIPNVAIVAIGLSLALSFLLYKTGFGRRLYAIGVSTKASRFTGLNIGRTLFVVYVIAALCAGLSGFFLTVRIGTGSANLSTTLAFDAIAACAIGGIPLSGGRGRISQVIFGTLLFSLLKNAVILLNFDSSWQLVLTGAVIIGSVLAQRGDVRVGSVFRKPAGESVAKMDTSAATEDEAL